MSLDCCRRILAGLLLVLVPVVSTAQEPPAQPRVPAAAAKPPAPSPPSGAMVKVFIDCIDAWCDFDFFRTDINFIDYVRDRRDADVHVLVTSESTGGGGRKYTMNFLGQGFYSGVNHLLAYVAPSNSTDDEIRRGMAAVIKMGLIHYVAGTDVASEIQISRPKPNTPQKAEPVRDPWDYWFFRTSVNGQLTGEQLTNSRYVSANTSASRVTDALKLTASGAFTYRQSRYTFSDGTDYTNYSRSASSALLLVKSLSPHWSAGGRVSASRSTYLNQSLAARVAPAIEYNVFPYAESTRKLITFNYSVGASHFRYEEETIYDKRHESLASQVGSVSLTVKQPWGSIETTLDASQYLGAGGRNHLSSWSSLDVRVFKGLSCSLSGNFERLHDQIYLPKAGATPEEVLVQRRQLATAYSYYVWFGVSYSFGSVHNNIVNSRFPSF